MSLTGHLKRSGSPIRRWFEERFPETSGVTRWANRRLRDGESDCPIPCPEEADASLAGTGLDFLLRACLQVGSIEETAASKAARALSRRPEIGTRSIEVESEAVDTIKRLDPSRHELTDPEWRQLCICCLVLARFEQLFRSIGPSPAIEAHLVDPLRRVSGLEDFVPLALNEAAISDLEVLGRTTWEDRRGWNDERPLVLSPRFELSSALGGADGDLIVGSQLVDLKATSMTKIIRNRDLWQLLGYAFADTKDEHRIREVAITAPRWRSLVSWPIEQLMRELAPVVPVSFRDDVGPVKASASADLKEVRADFAKVTQEGRPRRRGTFKGLPPRPK